MHTQLFVRSVIAHEVDLRLWQLVAIALVDPALNGLRDVGTFEAVEMVVAARIVAVGGEETAHVAAFESHAEIVGRAVDGRRQTVDFYFMVRFRHGAK